MPAVSDIGCLEADGHMYDDSSQKFFRLPLQRMLHRCLSCAIRRAAGCGKGTLRMSRTFSSNVLTDQSNQTEEPHVSVFLQRLVDVLNPADGQVTIFNVPLLQ